MAETSADRKSRFPGASLLEKLARTRAATRAVMSLERLWPLALPLALVAALFLALSWFGMFRIVPDWLGIGLVAGFALAAAASLLPFRRYRRPRAAEIDRRIERANALAHAPVTVQSDSLSAGGGDPFAEALWREHQKRMAGRLGALTSGLPRTRIPERDPWGLRAAVFLLLVTGFAFSYGPLGGRVSDAFVARPGVEAVPARIDAWVTPPAYTGRAPIYLTAEVNRGERLFAVPAGSEVVVRVTGGSGAETLGLMDERGTREIEPADAGSVGARQFGLTLERDGMLALADGDEETRSWAFQVSPDLPPVIRFTEEPRRALNGTLELFYEIEDDYGAVSAVAEFRQAGEDAEGARPLFEAPDMTLTLPRRGGRDSGARTSRDLTEHPWAGSRVDLTLKATDAAGQEGASETKTILLPERPFSNPLARALVEQRRLLALDAQARPRVLAMIDALTLRPEDTITNPSHYLGIMSARTRLVMARDDDQLREVVDYLWEIALAIEDGSLSAAERRLRQAQEALRQALENDASDEEIERLMAELREAMAEFLREFAERAMRDPNMAMQQMQQGQELRQSDLDRLLDQIEELARSGARDQAQELLSQLQNMMNNLQMAQPNQQGGEGGQQGEMRQQMDRLGELMRRQQEMMNETFRLDQMQRGQQQPGEGGMSPEDLAEALRQLQEGQGQLQQDLDALTEALREMGIEPGEGFGEAGEAMGRAEEALGGAEGERAVGEQGQALEALRRGAQDMMQQMQAMQQGGDDGEGQEGTRRQGTDRDPLGRPRATSGPDFGSSVEVPDEIDTQRARRILEEIRRRLGNTLSPELERDYLERLLRMR